MVPTEQSCPQRVTEAILLNSPSGTQLNDIVSLTDRIPWKVANVDVWQRQTTLSRNQIESLSIPFISEKAADSCSVFIEKLVRPRALSVTQLELKFSGAICAYPTKLSEGDTRVPELPNKQKSEKFQVEDLDSFARTRSAHLRCLEDAYQLSLRVCNLHH